MKKKVSFLLLFTILLVFLPSTEELVFAEDGEEQRESQEYGESRYDLMTYADDSWYEWVDKTGTAAVSSIKNFLWQINIVITQITLMIIYQMFSLDIVELTKDSIMEIASGTAGALITNLGMFAFAIACFGIVIRAYLQQNWQAFFKIVTLVVISMALLFSISSEKFNYVDLAHGISVSFENAVMQVNPSLTDSTNYEVAQDGNIGQQVSVEVENKAFDALLYKPYLLLQYGITDEQTINDEGSLNGEESRIEEYLKANPATEDGMELRQDIAEREFNEIQNENIFAGNAFKISAYIMGTIFSTIIQAIVFFFLALMRIMLQFAFVFVLLLVPFILFMSIFPTFEGLVNQYLKGAFMLVIFKAITVFLVLVSTSFITLSYEMVNMSDDIYYRIFIQTIFSISIIFMYMKRQFMIDMLNGATPSLSGMGAGEGMGRQSMRRFGKGTAQTKKGGQKAWAGTKKGGKVAKKGIVGTGKASKSVAQKSSNLYDKAGQYASAKTGRIGQKLGGKMQQAKEHIRNTQYGESPNHESPYHSKDQQDNVQNTKQQNVVQNNTHQTEHSSKSNVTPIHRSNGQPMRNPRVAKQNLQDSSQLQAVSSHKQNRQTNQVSPNPSRKVKGNSQSKQASNTRQNSQPNNIKSNQNQPQSVKKKTQNSRTGRSPYQSNKPNNEQPKPNNEATEKGSSKPNQAKIKNNSSGHLNREGKLNRSSLLHDNDHQ